MKSRSRADPAESLGKETTDCSLASRRGFLRYLGVGVAAGTGATGLTPALTTAADTSVTSPKAKLVVVIFKRSDLSHEQCLAEWTGDMHVSIVKAVPGVKKWVQNHVALMANDATPDGVGELWFDSPEAMGEVMKSPQMAAAFEDAKRFLDLSRTYALVVEEKILIP